MPHALSSNSVSFKLEFKNINCRKSKRKQNVYQLFLKPLQVENFLSFSLQISAFQVDVCCFHSKNSNKLDTLEKITGFLLVGWLAFFNAIKLLRLQRNLMN